MEPKVKKTLIFSAAGLIVLLAAVVYRCTNPGGDSLSDAEQPLPEPVLVYGLVADDYEISEESIKPGESLSVILARYGVSALMTDSLQRVSASTFDVRTIQAGKTYTAFVSRDTTDHRLCYFVYEKDPVNYVVMSFNGGIVVYNGAKEVTTERKSADLTITSSLWGAMMEAGLSYALAAELESVYAWTVDFFALQKGDNFRIIFDENYVEGERYGTGKVWGAWFDNGSKRYYAIPFGADNKGKTYYWDEQGNSLRKTMLKAPLVYSRISSTFSNSRRHPILGYNRAHKGVDYAAPAGTNVHAVADGTVTRRSWDSGGGNTIRIRHAHGGYETAYLHLRGFAKGISVGSRVSQGQLIGYVGSTGLSTGPHLHYGVYKNGVAINPLTVTSEPIAPVAAKDRPQFDKIKDLVLSALNGEISPDMVNETGDSLMIND